MTKSKAKKSAAKKAVVIVEKKGGKKGTSVAVIPTMSGKGDYKINQFSKLRGKGDYFSDLGSNLLGGLGRTIGGGLGGLVGTAFKSITGMGDYRTRGARANSLAGLYKTGAGTPFQMSEVGAQFAGGPPRVQHREYIGAVVAPATPGDFSTTVYYIQPGLRGQGTLFPWAASIASCFEQYRLHGMIMEFVSTSADYAASSGLGQVAMSTVYDAGASPLSNLSEVLNNEWSTTAKPAVSFVHPIECGDNDNQVSLRYVRSGNSAGSSSDTTRLDDVGIFQVTTFGLSAAAGTLIGELWATYDIEFYKPVLPDVRAGTTFHGLASLTLNAGSSAAAWVAGGTTTGLNVAPGSSIPIVPSSTIGGTLVMPASWGGNYMAIVIMGATGGTTLTSGTWYPGTGAGQTILPLNLLPGTSSNDSASTATLSGVGLCASLFTFTFTGAKDANLSTTTFVSSITATTYTGVWVLPLDNDVLTATGQVERELALLFKGRDSVLRSLLTANLTGNSPACSSSSVVSARPGTPRPLDESNTGASTPLHVEAEYGIDQSVHISRSKLATLLSGLKNA